MWNWEGRTSQLSDTFEIGESTTTRPGLEGGVGGVFVF